MEAIRLANAVASAMLVPYSTANAFTLPKLVANLIEPFNSLISRVRPGKRKCFTILYTKDGVYSKHCRQQSLCLADTSSHDQIFESIKSCPDVNSWNSL